MKRKWKDNRGETLVEALASILIGTLSIALLFSAVIASINMENTAEKADKNLSDSLKAAEEQTVAVSVPTGMVHVDTDKDKDYVETYVADGWNWSNEGTSGKNVSANFYGGEGAWSFALQTSPP